MKKRLLAASTVLAFTLGSCQQVANIFQGEDDSIKALRAALDTGIVAGTNNIAHFGYMNYTEATGSRSISGDIQKKVIKIFLPQEVNQVLDLAESNSFIGGAFMLATKGIDAKTMRSDLIRTINQAADTAAPKSIAVFKSAITSMSVSDGMSILKSKDASGKQDSIAATRYLNTNTRDSLTVIYKPIVRNALDKVGAATAWSQFKDGYNSVMSNGGILTRGLPTKLPELDSFATVNALDGLYSVVGHEEVKIRREPAKYTSEVIRKIFGSL